MSEKDLIFVIAYCKQQHDVECNQKYDKTLPYSYHLKLVNNFAKKFIYLLPDKNEARLAMAGTWAHDLIEDARITYNDIKDKFGEPLAEIVYCCTEEKGKSRYERHSQKFYDELKANKIAVFVKLCDIIANSCYSMTTNSSMFAKYKSEYDKTKMHLYRQEFMPMFAFLERLYEL